MSPPVTTCQASCITSNGAPIIPEDNASHPLPCQTSPVAPSAPHPMPFKNEVVSDEDIDRYNLPFPKGEGRWWTRDAERDYYLWGGLAGNPAYDDIQEGRFRLYVDGAIYWIRLIPGESSRDLYESPFIVNWESIAGIQPNTTSDEDLNRVTQILKEALTTYGYEGQDDNWVENTKVLFGF